MGNVDLLKEDLLDKDFNKAIGEYIKVKRLERGYSLQDLSDKINNLVTRQTLFKYETNQSNVRKIAFIELCKALEMDYKEALTDIVIKYLNEVRNEN